MPAALIFRIAWLLWSATYALPEPSKAIPAGTLNCAAAATPFALPATPEPAKVETTPDGVIFRIRWFPLSAT